MIKIKAILNLKYRWTNLILFKLSWFCAALLGDSGNWLLASLVLISFLLGPRSLKGLAIIAVLAMVGLAVDWSLLEVGIFLFESGHIPVWLGLLWLAFGQAIGHGFWFVARQQLVIQGLIGAMAGCVSYYAGMKLGAFDFGYPTAITLLILAIVWSVLLPGLFYIDARLKNA
jgi:hypothetical protein